MGEASAVKTYETMCCVDTDVSVLKSKYARARNCCYRNKFTVITKTGICYKTDQSLVGIKDVLFPATWTVKTISEEIVSEREVL